MSLKNFFLSSSLKYLFNILAVFIVIASFLSIDIFKTTESKVLSISTQSTIRYTDEIANNIVQELKTKVKKNFYAAFETTPSLQKYTEHILQLFVTEKYKYIYLVDKKKPSSKHYRFLADGSLEDKSAFGEIYTPMDPKWWEKVYQTKQSHYFIHKNVEDVWMTYLKPVLVDGKVEAILVIDFSMAEQKKIDETLRVLTKLSHRAFLLFLFVFVLVVFFSYVDLRRERAKQKTFQKVQELNKRLESDVKKAIEETKEAEKMLQQQTRLAQMGEMISMIAHQWRQPLSSISSAALAIRMRVESKRVDFEDAAQRQKFLDFTMKKLSNIGDYTQILSTTIDDFRNFFKSDKTKESIKITAPIEKALFIIEAAMVANNIRITKEYNTQQELPLYPNEMMQVILNILKNAEDNFKEKQISNAQITITTQQNDEILSITICDNGGGIDDKIMDKIFDPYFSTKEERNGSGLGLYMSKTMVEEHNNGTLRAYNTQEGVCFEIVFLITGTH